MALREEVALTSRLIRDHLGHECVGLRPPFGYYQGLRGRPDLLGSARRLGHPHVTSWGRDEHNACPTPWVQPFTYADEGLPGSPRDPVPVLARRRLVRPARLRDGPQFLEALRGAVDHVAENDLVYGACFHDWVMLASDEERVGWLRGFLEYAKQRGVEIVTYTDYWRRFAVAA